MKCPTYMMVLTAGILLCFTGPASSAEKSVILGFHQKPGPSEQALIHGAKGIIKKTFHLIPAMAVSLPEEEIAALKQDSRVAYVEEDAVFTAVEPLLSDEYVNSWGVERISSDVAHVSGNKGKGVNVGVLDTGIYYTHPELDGNYRGGYDFVYNDNDPFESYNSHGTHVAGIIAAEEDGLGVIGVAPEANIYAIKVLDSGGFGLLSWIISGLDWAVLHGMDIVNMSFEGRHFDSLKSACDAAYASGVLLVAAAGNLGQDVRYPAAYDSVIAVTGTDASDMQAFPPQGPQVELAAPGVNILSACTLSNPLCGSSGGYLVMSGTSQAAPHVSGTAALFLASDLQDVNGDGIINHKDVRKMLQSTATDLGAAGKDPVFGFGLVNAAEAALPTLITINRTHGFPKKDAKTTALTGALYKIAIENNGLSGVRVDVYEAGVYQEELSSKYSFKHKARKKIKPGKAQDITFNIDAAGKNYEVTFTPMGKPGNSLNIMISKQGEE